MSASKRDDLSEQASMLAAMARLDLSPERLATLASSLPVLLAQLKELRTLDAEAHEPPVMTFEDEARE